MKKPIRYATLIKIMIDKFELQQQNFCFWLQMKNHKPIDKSTISNYANGKTQLKKEITADAFFNALFMNESMSKEKEYRIPVNDKTREKLYQYLKENDFDLNNRIVASYNGKDNISFIKNIIDEADKSRQKKISGSGLEDLEGDEPSKESTKKDILLKNFDISSESLENFIGREEILKQLEENLDANSFTIICGIGGMGKSKCAQKYAFDSKGKGKYSSIQQLYFETNLTTTLLRLEFSNRDEQFANDKEHLESNLRLLGKQGPESLLIIDNFDKVPDESERNIIGQLKEFSIHVLITTREMQMDIEKYMVKITPLSKKEQSDLFAKHYGCMNDSLKRDLGQIIALIESHTMLIEMIAKTMRDNVMTAKEMYESLISGDENSVPSISIMKDNKYENEEIYSYIAKLFNISNIDEGGRSLLMKLTLSGVSGIRLWVLKKFLLKITNISVVNNLVNQSWIIREYRESPMEERVHLHTAIRTSVIKSTKPSLDFLREYIKAAVLACNTEDKGIEKGDKHDLRIIIMNAGKMFLDEYKEADVELLQSQALTLKEANESNDSLKTALLFYKKCIDLKDGSIDGQYTLSKFYIDCGDVDVRLADYDSAVSSYEKGIDFLKDTSKYVEMADAYNKLANLYRKDSKYDEAKKVFSIAEKIVKENDVKDPFLKAEILNNMGILYINLSEYDNAINYYKQAKEIREQLEESIKRDKALAYSYQNIGTVYQRQNNFSEAIIWHNKALELRKQVYSDEHSIIADSLTMIGNDITEEVHANTGTEYCKHTFEDAKKYFDSGLSLRLKKLGPMHPATAWSYQSLGKWALYQNLVDEAISYFENCLKIRRKVLGNEHAYTADVLYWLGVANSGCYPAKARKCLQEAAEIQRNMKLEPALALTEQFLKKL